MNTSKRLKYTRGLVLFSILGSFISLYTSVIGKGEFYPFFYWKLYTQPSGWDDKIGTIRIYAKHKNDSCYTRIPLKKYTAFSKDEVSYSLDYATALMSTDSTKAKQLFTTLCTHLEPSYTSYKIVQEVYNPRYYLKGDKTHHDYFIAEIYR